MELYWVIQERVWQAKIWTDSSWRKNDSSILRYCMWRPLLLKSKENMGYSFTWTFMVIQEKRIHFSTVPIILCHTQITTNAGYSLNWSKNVIRGFVFTAVPSWFRSRRRPLREQSCSISSKYPTHTLSNHQSDSSTTQPSWGLSPSLIRVGRKWVQVSALAWVVLYQPLLSMKWWWKNGKIRDWPRSSRGIKG